MSGLLISVRNAAEAECALRGGADVIDVKEPDRGALGASTADVWREVLQNIDGRRLVSCALGELHEPAVIDRARQAVGMSFAKAGLSQMRSADDWSRHWQLVQRALPADVQLVAVIYADWQQAAAPQPQEILERCAALGCRYALLDTWQKERGGLFQCLDEREVGKIVALAKDFEMQIVLAGSLTLEDLPRALSLAPKYVGFRGAACVGGRAGRISETLVRQLSSGVRDFPSTNLNCAKKRTAIA